MTAKSIDNMKDVIGPVQPLEAVDSTQMVGVLRDKVNELIDVVNVLIKETQELKKV